MKKNTFLKRFIIFLALSILVSCTGKAKNENIKKATEKESKEALKKSENLIGDKSFEKLLSISNEEEKIDKVSIELFLKLQSIQSEKDNFILSPFSIQRALSLISENISDKNNLTFLTLYDKIKLPNNFQNTNLDNLILLNKAKTGEPKKKADNIKLVEFPNEALKEYKNFQQNLFDEVIDETTYKSDIVLSVIDGIIFKGKWDEPFDKKETKDKEFTKSDGSKIKVPTMTRRFEEKKAILNDKIEAFSMTSDLSTIYFIKIKDKNLNNTEEIYNIINKFGDIEQEKYNVTFSLPKVNTKNKIDLKPIFNILGLKEMLISFKMDKLIDNNLMVDDAFQVATLTLDEEKIEAKAITRIDIKETAVAPNDFKEIEIKMDSPFMIIIKDNLKDSNSGNIVFMSHIEDPSK